MGGLLYKDFVAAKGKETVGLLLFWIVAFIALRLCFRTGGGMLPDLSVLNDDGVNVDIADLFSVTFLFCYWISMMVFMNNLVPALAEEDRKNKMVNYIRSLPLSQNTYLASKYVYILIYTYVIFSVYFALSIVCKAFCTEGLFLNYAEYMDQMVPVLASASIVMTSVELPMVIRWGKAKTVMILNMLLLAIGMAVNGYFMFGDLSFWQSIDYQAVMNFFEKYAGVILVINVISPLLALGIYYLSYRIVARIAQEEVA